MKKFIRIVTVVLLLGGWGLSAAALYVIRTPNNLVIMPKDRLTWHDTFVDTRRWTLADVRAHPAVVSRMIQRGRAGLLVNAVDPSRGHVEAQLTEAIQHPQDAPPTTNPTMDRVKAQMNAATSTIKQVFD